MKHYLFIRMCLVKMLSRRNDHIPLLNMESVRNGPSTCHYLSDIIMSDVLPPELLRFHIIPAALDLFRLENKYVMCDVLKFALVCREWMDWIKYDTHKLAFVANTPVSPFTLQHFQRVRTMIVNKNSDARLTQITQCFSQSLTSLSLRNTYAIDSSVLAVIDNLTSLTLNSVGSVSADILHNFAHLRHFETDTECNALGMLSRQTVHVNLCSLVLKRYGFTWRVANEIQRSMQLQRQLVQMTLISPRAEVMLDAMLLVSPKLKRFTISQNGILTRSIYDRIIVLAKRTPTLKEIRLDAHSMSLNSMPLPIALLSLQCLRTIHLPLIGSTNDGMPTMYFLEECCALPSLESFTCSVVTANSGIGVFSVPILHRSCNLRSLAIHIVGPCSVVDLHRMIRAPHLRSLKLTSQWTRPCEVVWPSGMSRHHFDTLMLSEHWLRKTTMRDLLSVTVTKLLISISFRLMDKIEPVLRLETMLELSDVEHIWSYDRMYENAVNRYVLD